LIRDIRKYLFLLSILKHSEFVADYASGRVTGQFDAPAAARLLSARLLLPLLTLPVLGLGVALALTGWIGSGLAIIAAGIIVPRLIKRSAPRFLLTQALQDPALFDEMVQSGVMQVVYINQS
jgi:hypothetical protein